MVVGILKIKLHIPESNSLKVKRMVLRSVKQRVRNNFNVSVIEADYQDKWQVTLLVFACVGNHSGLVNSALSKIVDFMSNFKGTVLLDYDVLLQNGWK